MNPASPSASIERFSEPWIEPASALEKEDGDVQWSRTHFEKELRLDISRFFVLIGGEQLIGYGGFWKVQDEAQITNLVIRRDCRRSGHGRRLLDRLIQEAVREGCTRFTLEVRESNAAAQALYRKCGFQVVGYRPGVYERPLEDAVLMEKKLNA